jgi:hypothetical protein
LQYLAKLSFIKISENPGNDSADRENGMSDFKGCSAEFKHLQKNEITICCRGNEEMM